ncbi:MAG TPA: anthranilate phosphoribosyltransferase, partial [Sinorhizobium sp.]|nr:anthranilate phosphoribosyltransferase [Sinorhizobium sp.]
AEVLRDLGSESVWVVHGDGLDEITTTGVTKVAALEDGKIRSFELTPADFGLAPATLDALKGGDGPHNAAALQAVLDGEENAYRDISLANAAASLMIAGRAKNVAEGMELARQSLSSGAAKTALQRLITVSNAA